MKIAARTIITEHLKGLNQNIEVRVDNTTSDNMPYGIDVGCVDEWLTDGDFTALLRVLQKAESLRVIPPKKARAKKK